MSLHRSICRSTLSAAIRSNDIQIIQSVLASRRTLRSLNGVDFHLLRQSIQSNRKEITELLLDHGCRVNLTSFSGDSPLHLAVLKPNCYSLVKRLLRRGADVNRKNKLNETPIQVAFYAGAGDKVMRLLLKAYLKASTLNVTNDVGLSYLHMACATADLDFVREFVEEGGADINARVREGCNSPYAGSTPLHMAVEFGKTEVIAYLLEQGADVSTRDVEGSTAIHLALELGETDLIELLFEYDRDRRNCRNDYGLSHFMAACACSGPQIAKEFLAKQLNEDQFWNVNETVDCSENPDNMLNGFTPLHFAAIYGRLETTELLLENGADCCAVTSENDTPFKFAYRHGYKDVADVLKARCQGFDWFLKR